MRRKLFIPYHLAGANDTELLDLGGIALAGGAEAARAARQPPQGVSGEHIEL